MYLCNYFYCSYAITGGNTINNFQFAGVYGCKVSAVVSCALHANNFVAQDMPDQTALPLPSGTLYYCSTTNVVYRA
jgi:hypothetical protein